MTTLDHVWNDHRSSNRWSDDGDESIRFAIPSTFLEVARQSFMTASAHKISAIVLHSKSSECAETKDENEEGFFSHQKDTLHDDSDSVAATLANVAGPIRCQREVSEVPVYARLDAEIVELASVSNGCCERTSSRS